MKHKLLVDAVSLLSPISGIGRYTYEISKFIVKNTEFETRFFYGYHSKVLKKPSTEKSLVVKRSFLKPIARKILLSMAKVYPKRYHTYWQPNFIPNRYIKADKIVTTFHDFSYEYYKEFHPKERVEYFEKNIKYIKNSDLIITGSNYVKGEILQRFDFEEKDIKVIYHGIDHENFKVYDDMDLSIKLPEMFFLYVGSLEPRKNIQTLIKAYTNLPKIYKDRYKLLIVGAAGWENSDLLQQIKHNNINLINKVDDKMLAYLYNKAFALVYPSVYEGFGLPPLEAMACGCPVITSNKSSMPEICDKNALYFEPYQTDELIHQMQKLIEDKNLRDTLITDGLKHSKEFTWEKSAQKHMELF